jgi:hypothetical protein
MKSQNFESAESVKKYNGETVWDFIGIQELFESYQHNCHKCTDLKEYNIFLYFTHLMFLVHHCRSFGLDAIKMTQISKYLVLGSADFLYS